MKPPPYYYNLMSAVSDDDREWFEDHPDKSIRFRDIVPGEFWPYRYPAGSHVVVYRLGPRERLRVVAA